MADAARLVGCLLGGYVGDAAGAVLEFKARVTDQQARGAMELRGGGPHNVAPGQVTDDSELDMALVRALGCARLDADAILRRAAAGYIAWHRSEPFDVGQTIGRAFAFAQSADECLSHPSAVCQAANAAYVSALAHVLATRPDAEPDRDGAVAAALRCLGADAGAGAVVRRWIEVESAQDVAEIQARCGTHAGDTDAKIGGNMVGALDPGGVPPDAAARVRGFDCTVARDDLLGHVRPAAYRVADALAVASSASFAARRRSERS